MPSAIRYTARREAADQPVGVGDDGVEHRSHVRRRGGDHLQDVGRRSLPLQRLLRFVEQPYVFDRDHGLVGEGLQQLDVMCGKWTGITSTVAITPIDAPLLIKGAIQHTAKAARPCYIP